MKKLANVRKAASVLIPFVAYCAFEVAADGARRVAAALRRKPYAEDARRDEWYS